MATHIEVDRTLRDRFSRQFLNSPTPELDTVFDRLICFQAQIEKSAWASLSLRVERLNSQTELDEPLIRTWSLRGTMQLSRLDDAVALVLISRSRNDAESRRVLKNHGLEWSVAEEISNFVIELLHHEGPASRDFITEAISQRFGEGVAEQAITSWGGVLKVVSSRCLLDVSNNESHEVRFRIAGTLPQLSTADALNTFVPTLWQRFAEGYGPASVSEFATWLGVGVRAVRQAIQETGTITALAEPAHDTSSDEEPPVVRILPEFDPYIVSPACRQLYFASEQVAQGVVRKGGWLASSVIYDGLVVGFAAPKLTGKSRIYKIDPGYLGAIEEIHQNGKVMTSQGCVFEKL